MNSVLRANPKKNLNGIQLDPLGHKNTEFSMDLSESGNSMKIMSPEQSGKKNAKSKKFEKLFNSLFFF